MHPQRANGPNYIIRFVEPDFDNRGAIGLNIAFEEQRLAAAERARDTGAATMSGHIVLVTDLTEVALPEVSNERVGHGQVGNAESADRNGSLRLAATA